MEVRSGRRAAPGRTDGAQTLTGFDRLTTPDRDRRQVQVGRVEAAVAGTNRHDQSRDADPTRVPDPAIGGGDDRRAGRRGDIDASVLAGGVGVSDVPVSRDDGATHRPVPADGSLRMIREGSRAEQRSQGDGDRLPEHGDDRTAPELADHPARCASVSNVALPSGRFTRRCAAVGLLSLSQPGAGQPDEVSDL
jgi:hypothetical protein